VIALVEDAAIAFDDLGAGMPVLFLHAFPLNRTMWAPQTSALVAQWRCIAPDFRGLGESTGEGPWTVDRFADDVVSVLDGLSIARAAIVGLSMGGYVALALWRRHRERVRGLVLADTRAGADSEETRARRAQLIEVARTKGSEAVASMQIAGLVGKSTREKNPDVYDALHRMMAQAPEGGIIGGLQAMMSRPDSTSLLGQIDLPTLVVVGDEDVVTPVKEARAMHEAIPASRFEVLTQAGHLSSAERPAAFNTVLSEFLGSLEFT
jgi:pimeloyl-ACP methyl ester carboxylesterase